MNFLDFVLESEREFYGGLLSEGFRCCEFSEETQENEYLIPESEILLILRNFPKAKSMASVRKGKIHFKISDV